MCYGKSRKKSIFDNWLCTSIRYKSYIFEDTEILYEGAVEDAPEEIKRLRYSKVKNSDKMNFYVYNSN